MGFPKRGSRRQWFVAVSLLAQGFACGAPPDGGATSSDEALISKGIKCPLGYSPHCLTRAPLGIVTCTCEENPPVTISQCGTTISTPGSYTLGADLATTPSGPCITVENTSNVTLDCGNHLVSSGPGAVTQEPQQAIFVSETSGITIQNCRVQAGADYVGATLEVSQSSTIVLANDTFLENPSPPGVSVGVQVLNSENVSVSGSTFRVPYEQGSTSGLSFTGNTLTCALSACPALIASSGGGQNSITNNVLDGKAAIDAPPESPGADDGIVVGDETADVVLGNTIQNTWDCGIETSGNVSSSMFAHNTVTNASLAGICGYHYLSFENNTVESNTVNGAATLFLYLREDGLRPANWDGRGAPAETAVSFTNNLFSGNTITSVYGGGWVALRPGFPSLWAPTATISDTKVTSVIWTAKSVPLRASFI